MFRKRLAVCALLIACGDPEETSRDQAVNTPVACPTTAEAMAQLPAALPLVPAVSSGPVPGSVAGTFGVSAAGSATYRISLNVPPGRAGMAPSLSINYDSANGESTLGVGASIAHVDKGWDEARGARGGRRARRCRREGEADGRAVGAMARARSGPPGPCDRSATRTSRRRR